MRKNVKLAIDSFWAGVMIAISSILYLATSVLGLAGQIVGAFLFSGALLTICWFKMKLFTGVIGYVRTFHQAWRAILVLVWNLIGTLSIKCFAHMIPDSALEAGTTTFLSKLGMNYGWHTTFFAAVLCGILIYIAVEQYKQGRAYAILLAVPAFVLSGARHCIAEFCDMLVAGSWSWRCLLYMTIVIAGNSLGALLLSLWEEHRNSLSTPKQEENNENSGH